MCKLHPLMKNEMVLAVSSSKRAVMMLSLVLSLENKKNANWGSLCSSNLPSVSGPVLDKF